MEESQRRILGVDPGLNTTGYGIVDITATGPRLTEAGIIRTGRGDLSTRLEEIHTGLAELIESFQPAAMALEELYSHYQRPRTAILMGHARGVICLAAQQANIPVTHYAATKIKKMLTGHGRAPKSQMQAAICREFALAQSPEPPDVADALAIALCHYFATKNTSLRSALAVPRSTFAARSKQEN
jgi:crossover junction endodeoxyribonuclease RuvC